MTVEPLYFVGMFALYLVGRNYVKFIERLAERNKKDRDGHAERMRKYYNYKEPDNGNPNTDM